MRCRQCGKELPLFKKLADNDFCSAEHRELYLDEQQRAMVARLAESGRRLKRRLAPGRAPEPPLFQPIDPNPAPRPPAGFLTQAPQQRDRLIRPRLAAELMAPAAALPGTTAEAAQNGIRLAPRQALPSIPPRDVRNHLHAIAISARGSIAPVLPPLFTRADARYAPGATEKLFRMRPRSGVQSAAPSQMPDIAFVAAAATPAAPRLHLRVVGYSIPDALVNPKRIHIPPQDRLTAPVLFIDPSPDSREATARTSEAVSHPVLTCRFALEPCISARLLRARPRTPVDSATPLNPITAAAGEQLPELALPAARLNDRSAVPRFGERLFRMRPRAGVTAAVAPFTGIDLALVASAAHVAALPRPLGSVIGSIGEPPLLERTLRMRPRGPVGTPELRFLLIPPAPVGSRITRSTPVIHVEFHPLPRLMDREYRMRPRRPIGAAAPEPVAIAPAAGPAAVRAHIAGIRTAFAMSPRLVDREYRMRPRRPIGSTAADPLVISCLPAPAAARPSIAASRPQFAAVPRFVDREYRLRPRGPVCTEGPLLRISDPAAFGSRIHSAVPHSAPQHAYVPRFVERLYRMRPRTGVNARGNAGAQPVLQSLPVEIRLLVPRNTVRACAPQPTTRIFRMRPRSPIANPGAELLRTMGTGPAEASEIFVMPPVPELRVVRTFELQRAQQPKRTLPPGPTAATGDQGSTAGPEPLDPALVARAAIQVRFPTITAVIRLVQPETRRQRYTRLARSLAATYFSTRCWRMAPALRLSSCGAAVLMVILIYTASNSSASSAASATGEPAGTLSDFRKTLAARSAVNLNETFASGLHEWEGGPNWAASWTYDDRGGIKPGALALYKATAGLQDYTFEFMGQIEQKALAFVTRAADIQNYYVVKLVITQPGPLPEVKIVRYPVIGGREAKRIEKRLVMTVYRDTIYRVKTTVREDTWTLAVNDQIVDSWTDDRLPAGGVGLFAGKGERSRMYDLRVRHQDDTIGKVLATISDTRPQGTRGIPGK